MANNLWATAHQPTFTFCWGCTDWLLHTHSYSRLGIWPLVNNLLRLRLVQSVSPLWHLPSALLHMNVFVLKLNDVHSCTLSCHFLPFLLWWYTCPSLNPLTSFFLCCRYLPAGMETLHTGNDMQHPCAEHTFLPSAESKTVYICRLSIITIINSLPSIIK